MSETPVTPKVEDLTEMPKFLSDIIPADATRREADAIKISLIRKFGFKPWQQMLGRTASKAKQ